YKVIEAPDGAQALRAHEAYRGPIHLILTDVVVPGPSGRELAEKIVSARPEARILYMSGYTDDAVVRHGVLSADVAFLEKPFTPQRLLLKVREALDAEPDV